LLRRAGLGVTNAESANHLGHISKAEDGA